MNTADMIAQLRLNTLIEDDSDDYTDAVLLRELYHALCTKFQAAILDARRGYWLHYRDYQLAAGTASVRLPARNTSLARVQISNGSSPTDGMFIRLPQTEEGHAELFERAASSLGMPRAWVNRGDRVQVMPAADSTGYWLRVWYYTRPSQLVANQDGKNGSTERGRVTAVDTAARTVTVNQIPYDMSLSPLGTITSNNQKIDIVHPDGWHELALVDAPQTFASLTFTIGGTQTLDHVEVGDYLRAADQSEWPQIPDDFHRCIVDVASIKILVQRDFPGKANGFAQDVSSDLARFHALISNRVREEPRKIRAPLPSLRRRVLI